MTALAIALATVGLALVGTAAAAMALALRNGKLAAEIGLAAGRSSNAEKQLSETSKEFLEYKRRTDAQLVAVRGDVEELERDLEKCATPGARRERLNKLLGKLSSRGVTAGTGSGNPTGSVPVVAATGTAGDSDSGT